MGGLDAVLWAPRRGGRAGSAGGGAPLGTNDLASDLGPWILATGEGGAVGCGPAPWPRLPEGPAAGASREQYHQQPRVTHSGQWVINRPRPATDRCAEPAAPTRWVSQGKRQWGEGREDDRPGDKAAGTRGCQARCPPKATRPGARGDRARDMGTEGAKGQHRGAACKGYGRAWQLLRQLNSYCVAQQFHHQVEEE